MKKLLNYFLKPTIKKLIQSPIINNSGWMLGERIVRLAIGFFVAIWVARYLGPEQFGLLQYSIAFTMLFSVFVTLGLKGIVIHEFSKAKNQPKKLEALLGTTITLKLIGAFLGIMCVWLILLFTDLQEDSRILIFIISTSFIFQAFLPIESLFQSKLQSRIPSIAQGAAFLSASIIKIGLILFHAPLVYFAVASVIESSIAAAYLYFSLRRSKVSFRWRLHVTHAKTLLSRSWPLILSGIGASLYLKIDQVMLGFMRGTEEVGIYAVAAQLSEFWYFIPAAIATSAMPILVNTKKESLKLYKKQLQKLFNVFFLLAFVAVIGTMIFATPVISLFYGEAYTSSGPILKLHIFAALFVFGGALLSKWIIIEDHIYMSLFRHISGAVINIALNIFLIPKYGGIGAAAASVVSYAVANYVICFLYPHSRPVAAMMTKSFIAPLQFTRNLLRK